MLVAHHDPLVDRRNDSYVPALIDLGALEFSDSFRCSSLFSGSLRFAISATEQDSCFLKPGCSCCQRLVEQDAFLFGANVLLPAC